VRIKFTKHAREMLVFRKIGKKQVETTVKNPDDKSTGKSERIFYTRISVRIT